MDCPERHALLVVEGDKEEHRLVNSLFKAFAPDAKWRIHTYGTVIHDLIEKINVDYGGDFDNIEIRKVLVDMLPDGESPIRDMLLYTRFTDVILMFDFDPQDDRMSIDGLRKMVELFNDSGDTDRGLLLINYPAVESVKEAAALHYDTFLESFANSGALDSYKQDVSQKVSKVHGRYADFRTYDARSLVWAIGHTVGKVFHQCKSHSSSNHQPPCDALTASRINPSGVMPI